MWWTTYHPVTTEGWRPSRRAHPILLTKSAVSHIHCRPSIKVLPFTSRHVLHMLKVSVVLLSIPSFLYTKHTLHRCPAGQPVHSVLVSLGTPSCPMSMWQKGEAWHCLLVIWYGGTWGGLCLNLSGLSSACLPVCFSMSNPFKEWTRTQTHTAPGCMT